MREGQMRLLLQINALVYEIRDAPATTTEDFLALLDVAIEHELDLAPDIAFYGPADYPIIARLLRALARMAPGFEFNSLRRWLSSPGQFEQLMGDAPSPQSEGSASGESNQQRSQINCRAQNGYKQAGYHSALRRGRSALGCWTPEVLVPDPFAGG